MFAAIQNYFHTLAGRFGQGWNQFWFTPTDPLTLGVLRVLTGLLALYWVGTYSFDLDRFFGPQGMVSLEIVELARGAPERGWRFSYLDYLKTPEDLRAGHVAALVVLALFVFGCWTRVTSVLALAVVLSYFHRGPLVTSLVEPVLAFVIFYLCLGPAGAYCSVDRWWARRKARSRPAYERQAGAAPPKSWAATVSVRLVQVHVTLVYVMMGLGKLYGDVWWDGTAVWSLVAKPQSPLVDLTWLARHPYLVNAWTHAIVAFELGFAVLVWNRLARPLLLAVGLVMWCLLAPVTGLVTFSLMMAVANLAFVSPEALHAACSCCGGGRAGSTGSEQPKGRTPS